MVTLYANWTTIVYCMYMVWQVVGCVNHGLTSFDHTAGSIGPWEKIPFISWEESDFRRGHFPLKTPVFLMCKFYLQYTVIKVSDFSVPRRGVTNQTLPGREQLFLCRGEFGK
jgi:hypothetical protein